MAFFTRYPWLRTLAHYLLWHLVNLHLAFTFRDAYNEAIVADCSDAARTRCIADLLEHQACRVAGLLPQSTLHPTPFLSLQRFAA